MANIIDDDMLAEHEVREAPHGQLMHRIVIRHIGWEDPFEFGPWAPYQAIAQIRSDGVMFAAVTDYHDGGPFVPGTVYRVREANR